MVLIAERMTITQAFTMGGILSVVSLLIFIYLCKKLSINYTYFLVQSFLGFAVGWVLLWVMQVVALHDFYNVGIGLALVALGMFVHHQIIGFGILFMGLVLFYEGVKMGSVFWILSDVTTASFLSDPIFKTMYAFWVMMAMFLVRTIIHKKCCANRIF